MWIGSFHPCLPRTTNYSYITPLTYTHNTPTPVQTVGCIVMGNVSDRYGRRPVMLCCLAASFCSLSVVARARTLPQVINEPTNEGSIYGWSCVSIFFLATAVCMHEGHRPIRSLNSPPSFLPHNTKKVALGRVIGGMFGGFVPLAQSAVADLTPVEGRAKFLGRIQVRGQPRLMVCGLLHMCMRVCRTQYAHLTTPLPIYL